MLNEAVETWRSIASVPRSRFVIGSPALVAKRMIHPESKMVLLRQRSSRDAASLSRKARIGRFRVKIRLFVVDRFFSKC